MVTNRNIDDVMRLVGREAKRWKDPSVTRISKERRDPYRVLIGCLLSLRTKDDVTTKAAERLFALADTPEEMIRLPVGKIEKAIYPAGFYRKKARLVKEISRTLLRKGGGSVPDTLEGLLELKGVGRKTANLVLTRGHDRPGICVDIHVHRITNRWGYVKTASPDATEFALRERLPKKHWKRINDLLVAFGQNLCRPISPFCSVCPIRDHCAQSGVLRSR